MMRSEEKDGDVETDTLAAQVISSSASATTTGRPEYVRRFRSKSDLVRLLDLPEKPLLVIPDKIIEDESIHGAPVASSDLVVTEMQHQEVVSRIRVRGGNRKTKSDLVLMLNLPDEPEEVKLRRQREREMILNFGYANSLGYEDLAYAEAIQKHGTQRVRIASGISDMLIKGEIEEKKDDDADFVLNHKGLISEEANELLRKYGKNELPEKADPKWLIFFRLLTQPMAIMLWLAVIIEAAIQNWVDMLILLLIQFVNAGISYYETTKAGDAIAALKNSLRPTATVKRDGSFQVIDGSLLVPGDTVLLASGSAIPADCRLNHGEIEVDQAALTGESLPVTFYMNDSCKMGSTVVRGEVEATVEFTGANTFFGKTASLLQENHEPSHLQKMLMKIMVVLVGMSVTLCIINFIYLVTSGETVKEALSFTIVLLVASIPLAIEIVTTTTLVS